MEFFSNTLNILLILSIAFYIAKKANRHKAERLKREAPPIIPQISLEAFDPIFVPDALGPTRATEVLFLGRGNLMVPGGTSDSESWILSVLAKKASTMFEFGTCTGKTAYLWARNSAPDARVITLTLPPEKIAEYKPAAGDSILAKDAALYESTNTIYTYSASPEEKKITQIYCDSKDFDPAPFAHSCDLIFIDGSHAYSYVKSDSENAFAMIRPGGVILWHDYRPEDETTKDVFAYLNELSASLTLVHLKETSIVAYRKT